MRQAEVDSYWNGYHQAMRDVIAKFDQLSSDEFGGYLETNREGLPYYGK